MSDDRKPPKEVITINEVSEILGPPRRSIWDAMRKKPDFPKAFKVGRSWFFVRAEVIAYREKLQAEFAAKHKLQTAERNAAQIMRSVSRSKKPDK
ncbi:helix-turn-helix domain-containing protein [Hyphomicrobium sp. CS1GBMeth3]|uniref:helix-turn-helix transcriptional regulator n=1 Tax=Hyphomicrobium sp. CS1GBMeth3 TaxID=1892845 RepID=UPI000930A757|nr:helix-turn-helix domain-containing protein [Hyphomicrobium sp. CS1GBMeth3]